MNNNVRHIYFIEVMHDGTGAERAARVPAGREGSFSVYSDQEIPPQRLHRIVDEVRGILPRGLSYGRFEEFVYRALKERGLHRVEDVKDHGTIGEIDYTQ